ncbi:hypothetical protein OSH04_02160 [Alcaligenes sp. A-TC2]|uniref:hypothetical protein n=1 Tax=Alcaligenes nematophilus TaxID=2994643 RepID=UPI00225575DA|nr:hypothetical protein [Alcaligenes nematophilus]MCX5470513.1 hypothetical protein [Alcaligenes nematophilus]
MNQEPLFWYRPRSDGGYEGPLHNGQIEDVRKASGAWVPLFAGAAPVSAEPTDDEIIDIAVEPLGIDCDRMPYGIVVFARALLSRYSSAPAATQPGLTQQTLEDVMAGTPARDAEIEALRKQVETLQAQLVDRSPEMQRKPVDESPNLQSQQKPVSGADGLTDAAIEMLAKQYDCHNAPGFKGFARAVEVFAQTYGRQEGWQARAALAQHDELSKLTKSSSQQDADKVDEDPLQGAADWMVKDCGVKYIAELARRLSIGYNRATRLMEAARKENSNA